MSPALGRVLLLIGVLSAPIPSRADLWNPFARKNPLAAPDPVAPDTPPAPLGIPHEPPRPLPTLERSKWPGMPSLPWSSAPRGTPTTSMWQRMQESTQRSWAKTRDAIRAPFQSSLTRRTEDSLWPRWRGLGDRSEVQPAGWFEEVPEEAPPEEISTVNDFLAQPRPE